MALKTFNMPSGGLILDDGSKITGKFQLDTDWFNSDGTLSTGGKAYTTQKMFDANDATSEMNLSVSTPTAVGLAKYGQVDFTSVTTQPSRSVDQNSSTVDKTSLDVGEMTLSYNSVTKVYTVSFFDNSSTDSNDRELSFSFTGNPKTEALTMSTSSFVKYESSTASDSFLVNPSNVICYSKGTLIATDKGDVLVEDLVAGDMVLTVSGQCAPIKWLGRRTVNCETHPNPKDAWPVCVKQGAFGDQLPKRDLYLSPLHSVYINGHLIPVIDLLNGSSIVQKRFAEVTYFHVELPTHNVIYAEGLPAESYLDDNNRDFFIGSDNTSVTNLHAEFSEKASSEEIWAKQGFAKVMRAGSPEVEAVKEMLSDRVENNSALQVAA